MKQLIATFSIVLITLLAGVAQAQSATVGANCAIGWTANTDADLASYRVYGTLTPAAGVAVAKTIDIVKPTVATTCAALGLQTGGTLNVQVDAVDVLGNRSAKSVVVTAIQDIVAPAQPTGLTITPSP
jgi:hypothetical protein